jgi:hypothetical protein
MDQRSFVLYLARKVLIAGAVYEDLGVTLGAGAISYPSVTRYFREAKFATSNPEVTFSESIREHGDCDQAILLALDEHSFMLIRQLARLAYPPRTTAHQCLMQSLRFQVRHP